MTTQRPVTQQDIQAFNTLVNRVLVHRDRTSGTSVTVSPGKVLTEQRQVAKECAQLLIRLKDQGKSIEQLGESAGLGRSDLGLSRFVCMSLIGEELQLQVMKSLSPEVDFIVGAGLVNSYEQHSRQASHLRLGNALPGSEYYVAPFVHPDLEFTDDLNVNTLRAAMLPAALTSKIITIFNGRKDESSTAEQCVDSIANLLKNCRLQKQKIHSESKNLLGTLPLRGNEALRKFILGEKAPTLSELSTKTHSLLEASAVASTSKEAYSALEDIVYGAHSNEQYAMRCLADDLIDAIREHVAQDERGMSDEYNSSQGKLKGFIDGFSLMRKYGVPVDYILLRAACDNKSGEAYELMASGAPAVINKLVKAYLLCTMPQADGLGCITPMYLLGGAFSHTMKDLKAAVENVEDRAALFYSMTGNRDFLQMIKSEKTQSELLAKDLGL